MPWLTPHPCRFPGCGNLVRGRSGHCDDHSAAARQRQDLARPSAARRGYDADWRRRRAAFLEEHPYCKRCTDPSDMVDHIVPLRDGGEDHESNWQALCTPCHSGPKQSEDHRRRRAAIRPGG